jgi:hypothetical protein
MHEDGGDMLHRNVLNHLQEHHNVRPRVPRFHRRGNLKPQSITHTAWYVMRRNYDKQNLSVWAQTGWLKKQVTSLVTERTNHILHYQTI